MRIVTSQPNICTNTLVSANLFWALKSNKYNRHVLNRPPRVFVCARSHLCKLGHSWTLIIVEWEEPGYHWTNVCGVSMRFPQTEGQPLREWHRMVIFVQKVIAYRTAAISRSRMVILSVSFHKILVIGKTECLLETYFTVLYGKMVRVE